MTRRLALLAALVVAACAGSSREPEGPRKGRSHDEILMLHGKILDWRQEMGLQPAPDPRLLRAFASEPHSQAPTRARSTAEPVPEVCRDTCNLADYICQAADDICRIADELGDDAWAEDKCASASASCSEARKRCDDCATRSTANKTE